MQNKINSFLNLAKIFKENGFKLFLVGGSVRDYFLYGKIDDLDVTSDATPEEVKLFLNAEIVDRFASFGALTIKFDNQKFDFTTLRKEKKYVDNRHPSKIHFVEKPKIDFKRRDFTLNALYLDNQFKLIDFCNGKKDLDNKILRMIGNPYKRIKEDPLRILRAIRFSLEHDLIIEKRLIKAINKHISLIDKLNKDKIRQEINKIKKVDDNKKRDLFAKFNIVYLLDMVK